MPVEGGRIKAIKRIAIASARKHRLALARAQGFFWLGMSLWIRILFLPVFS